MEQDLFQFYVRMFDYGIRNEVLNFDIDEIYNLKVMELVIHNFEKLPEDEVNEHLKQLKRAYEYFKNKQ